MQDLVDDEGIVVAGAETIDGLGHVLDQVAEACLVVRGNQRAIGLTLTLRARLAIVPWRQALLARERRLSSRSRPGPPYL
jgi:hypothetical protein